VEHDKGGNHRCVTLNYEVWLMLLGVNIDCWSDAYINKILGDHGQLIAWEEDPNLVARVLVKERVVNLQDIPWFVVSTEGPGFDSDSWTIQTEIIQATMLGGLAADEDLPRGPNDIQPDMFDFFGFGQQGQGPFHPHQHNDPSVPEGGKEVGAYGHKRTRLSNLPNRWFRLWLQTPHPSFWILISMSQFSHLKMIWG
jgi:hypothetical protein